MWRQSPMEGDKNLTLVQFDLFQLLDIYPLPPLYSHHQCPSMGLLWRCKHYITLSFALLCALHIIHCCIWYSANECSSASAKFRIKRSRCLQETVTKESLQCMKMVLRTERGALVSSLAGSFHCFQPLVLSCLVCQTHWLTELNSLQIHNLLSPWQNKLWVFSNFAWKRTGTGFYPTRWRCCRIWTFLRRPSWKTPTPSIWVHGLIFICFQDWICASRLHNVAASTF